MRVSRGGRPCRQQHRPGQQSFGSADATQHLDSTQSTLSLDFGNGNHSIDDLTAVI